MWRGGRNGPNPGMVPPWGRGSSSRGRTDGRNVLSDGSGGCRSRHSGGCSSGGCKGSGGGGSGGCRGSDGGSNGGLGPPTKGGEDCLTLGQKLCPPCVFTMARRRKYGEDGRRRGSRNDSGMKGREGGV